MSEILKNELEEKKPERNKFAITTRTGEILILDKNTVQKYVANGMEISDSEYNMFFQLCKVYQVNPFLKEAYLVKYSPTDPATIILDYKVLQQAVEDNKFFKGMKTGIILEDKNGNIIEREGSYLLSSEKLIAGWCEVKRSDREYPTKTYAMFEEFANRKKDGKLNQNWTGKPVFMITKVAKAHALREAFPNLFGSNVYTKEEEETFEKPNRDFINANVDEVEKEIKRVENTERKEKIVNVFESTEKNDVPTQNNSFDKFINEEEKIIDVELEPSDSDHENRDLYNGMFNTIL